MVGASRFRRASCFEAAELVAFDVLELAIRSRGKITERATRLHADETFRVKMHSLFAEEPTGIFMIPTLQDALERIVNLEKRLDTLEKKSTVK
ncbi:MAG: hypothetical protein O8C67_09205 [Candidatus Methanoperedens sp.]|nr:hypothetical protein [Candidatus Methanoperedens sp.]